MRINKFVAQASGLSRRAADTAINNGRVMVNDARPEVGATISTDDIVTLDGKQISLASEATTIMLNKPVGYVCSRNGQGSKTIYQLLPPEYQQLKSIGRLDKDSSGLLLMTDDGDLANELTHPRYAKTKIYKIALDKPLEPLHQQMIDNIGIQLEDGRSQLTLEKLDEIGYRWQVTMQEGRNRQIRRTFTALGYNVAMLQRIQFGNYQLGDLPSGECVISK